MSIKLPMKGSEGGPGMGSVAAIASVLSSDLEAKEEGEEAKGEGGREATKAGRRAAQGREKGSAREGDIYGGGGQGEANMVTVGYAAQRRGGLPPAPPPSRKRHRGCHVLLRSIDELQALRRDMEFPVFTVHHDLYLAPIYSVQECMYIRILVNVYSARPGLLA